MQRSSLNARSREERVALETFSSLELGPYSLETSHGLLSHLHDMSLCVFSAHFPLGEVLAVGDTAVYVMECSAS